jgi:hypothetical protein
MRREQVDKLKQHLRAKGYRLSAGGATGAGTHSLARVDADGGDEAEGDGEEGSDGDDEAGEDGDDAGKDDEAEVSIRCRGGTRSRWWRVTEAS